MAALESGQATQRVIDDVAELMTSPQPAEVVAAAIDGALDWFGNVIGARDEPLVRILVEDAREDGGRPAASAIPAGARMSASQAAFVNGSTADALDYADTHVAMRGHAMPAVVATALAMAEATGASGAEFLAAMIVGVETECRVGALLGEDGLRRGFHPTAVTAPFGCAAAAGRLAGLDDHRMMHALGIVATRAAGVHASGGTMCKPMHSGVAAMNGVVAARLARRGFTGRENVLETPDGFFEGHARNFDVGRLDALRGRFMILGVRFKSHAACQLTHGAIDAAAALVRAHAFRVDDIVGVDIQTPPLFLNVCNIVSPATALEAKFSLRVVTAMALAGDDTASIDAYAPARVRRPEIERLRALTKVTGLPRLTGGATEVTITLADGRILSRAGDCHAPVKSDEARRRLVLSKFHALAGPVIGVGAAARLRDAILSLSETRNVAAIVEAAMGQER